MIAMMTKGEEATPEIQTKIDPGIFKEAIGEATLTDRKIEIWVKLNTTELLDEIESLEKFRTVIMLRCNKNNVLRNECKYFDEISRKMLMNLREKFERLTLESRSKRGLIDGIGTGISFCSELWIMKTLI